MAYLCPNPNHTVANHGNCPLIHQNVSTLDDGGGETGTFPPKPPTPPPPPPGPTPGG